MLHNSPKSIPEHQCYPKVSSCGNALKLGLKSLDKALLGHYSLSMDKKKKRRHGLAKARRDADVVYYHIENPLATQREIAEAFGCGLHQSTISRILQSYNLEKGKGDNNGLPKRNAEEIQGDDLETNAPT